MMHATRVLVADVHSMRSFLPEVLYWYALEWHSATSSEIGWKSLGTNMLVEDMPPSSARDGEVEHESCGKGFTMHNGDPRAKEGPPSWIASSAFSDHASPMPTVGFQWNLGTPAYHPNISNLHVAYMPHIQPSAKVFPTTYHMV